MKQISIDALNSHLFETIEMLKNNNDPKASKNEKIDNETARTIAELGKQIVDGYKVKVQVLNLISRSENPKEVSNIAIDEGLIEKTDDVLKLTQ